MASGTPKGLKGRLWGRASDLAGFRVPCHWCGTPMTYAAATVDHEPALAEGGTPDGAVLACDACNQKRSQDTNYRVNIKRRGGGKRRRR